MNKIIGSSALAIATLVVMVGRLCERKRADTSSFRLRSRLLAQIQTSRPLNTLVPRPLRSVQIPITLPATHVGSTVLRYGTPAVFDGQGDLVRHSDSVLRCAYSSCTRKFRRAWHHSFFVYFGPKTRAFVNSMSTSSTTPRRRPPRRARLLRLAHVVDLSRCATRVLERGGCGG